MHKCPFEFELCTNEREYMFCGNITSNSLVIVETGVR
jgi:hypothetical protein